MTASPDRRRSPVSAPFRWLWHELTRIRLAVWILLVMGVTMIVGSIFPQGYDPETYISSWGEARYAALSRFGLLNLFHSKFFVALGVLLLLNLICCSVVRWFGRSGAGLSGETPPPHAREIEIAAEDEASALSMARRLFTVRGYKVLSSGGSVITARRGPWPEGVSLLYHLGMALAVIGFVISALTSFEGMVTLYPDEPVTVATVSRETGAFAFRERLADWTVGGWRPFEAARPDTTVFEGRSVTLTLDEFVTEWEYFHDKHYPKDWLSRVRVTGEGGGTCPYEVEVNRPLRVAGLTFYQMAYDQSFDVVVLKDGVEIERVAAQAYAPFTLESVGGMFFPGTMRVGTLFQRYYEPRPLVPHVPLRWKAPMPETEEHSAEAADTTEAEIAPPPRPERIEVGDLSAGEPLDVEGVTLMLENPYEGSVLSYRHDPAVPLLYVAVTSFLLGLAIRTYWPSYRVNLWIEQKAGGVRGRLVFRATGMLGEPEALEEDIVRELAGGDRD